MKDNLCAHCIHAVEVKYNGFFCDKTGYLENKSCKYDGCKNFKSDKFEYAEQKRPNVRTKE